MKRRLFCLICACWFGFLLIGCGIFEKPYSDDYSGDFVVAFSACGKEYRLPCRFRDLSRLFTISEGGETVYPDADRIYHRYRLYYMLKRVGTVILSYDEEPENPMLERNTFKRPRNATVFSVSVNTKTTEYLSECTISGFRLLTQLKEDEEPSFPPADSEITPYCKWYVCGDSVSRGAELFFVYNCNGTVLTQMTLNAFPDSVIEDRNGSPAQLAAQKEAYESLYGASFWDSPVTNEEKSVVRMDDRQRIIFDEYKLGIIY